MSVLKNPIRPNRDVIISATGSKSSHHKELRQHDSSKELILTAQNGREGAPTSTRFLRAWITKAAFYEPQTPETRAHYRIAIFS